MSEYLDNNIHKILSNLNVGDAMAHFKKKHYEDFFFEYRKSLSDVNEEIMKMYASDDRETEMNSAAESLVKYVKDTQEHTIFFKRSTYLVDMQCMMVFYALPNLLKNPTEEDSKQFTDIICSKWAEAFPKETISAATYEEIYDGFRTTIFGFNVEGMFGDSKKDGKGKK